MTFLLSWHGTLLCRERSAGGLVHRPLGAFGDADPVSLDLPWDRLRGDFDRVTRTGDAALESVVQQGPLTEFKLTVDGRRRWISLARDGLHLSAEREGRVSVDRREVRAWERFVPLTQSDIDHLQFVMGQSWVIRSSLRVLRPGEIRLADGHRLTLGEQSLDLIYQLPFDLALTPLRLTLLVDGWRIEQLCLFRPLIFSTAMRKPKALEQLWLNLRSLTEIARYRGHVHLLTDQSEAVILRNVPLLDPASLSVQRVTATDRVGAIASKFSIVDWPDAASFQPLLFVDADTIFDRDPVSMLAAVAASDRISAPVEDFSPMRVADSAGARLLAEDGFNARHAAGFNSGTLGIPNLHEHRHVLKIIRRIIANRADLFGRRSFSWVDQPVANYVSHRLAHVDTHLLNAFVRYGYPGIEKDVSRRSGLVHFWPPMDDDAKLTAMRLYVDALRETVSASPPTGP